MRSRDLVAAISAAFLCMILPHGPAAAQQDRPLLVDGRNSIYQRVLSRPGARLLDRPDGTVLETLKPMQPLYVYARDGDWISVGESPSFGSSGYISKGDAVEWKQNIVASFTNPSGRKRQILFDGYEDLDRLLESETTDADLEELLRQADAGNPPANAGVISVEPAEYVDIRENFYLMPIIDFVETSHPDDHSPMLYLEIASLPLRGAGGSGRAIIGTEFEVGVVFVIDTTKSMAPYIRQTREAVGEIIGGLRRTEFGDRIHFGAVGFRDNPDAIPGVEYRTRTIQALDRAAAPDAILGALDNASVAEVSTSGFNEDSLAGVEEAVTGTDWGDDQGRPFGGRYVVLVTDSGPKHPDDPNARSEIGSSQLQTLAEENGVAILTLHLQTPAGADDHAYAEGQYRRLSRFDGREYFYPIPGGREDAFRERIEALVEGLTGHASETEARRTGTQDPDPLAELGLAMRLRYLGAEQGSAAPDVIRAWAGDRAAEDPVRTALMPRLLLTRNELSSMATILQEILDAGEATQSVDDPGRFFRQVREAVSRLAQNPDLIVDAEFDALGGAMNDFLEGLPYESQIMQLTEERWVNAGTERREIIDRLRQRLTLYKRIHDDPSNWTPLYDGAPDGEHVYAMPFSALP